MKKVTIGIVLVTAMLALAGLIAAHGYENGRNHEDMEEGNYQDLVDYRQDTGFNMMPFVNNEEEFEEMQERHEIMEENHNGRMPCHKGHGTMWR